MRVTPSSGLYELAYGIHDMFRQICSLRLAVTFPAAHLIALHAVLSVVVVLVLATELSQQANLPYYMIFISFLKIFVSLLLSYSNVYLNWFQWMLFFYTTNKFAFRHWEINAFAFSHSVERVHLHTRIKTYIFLHMCVFVSVFIFVCASHRLTKWSSKMCAIK